VPGVYPVQRTNSDGSRVGDPRQFAYWDGADWGVRSASIEGARPYNAADRRGRRRVNPYVFGERVECNGLLENALMIIQGEAGISQAQLILRLKDINAQRPLDVGPTLVEVDRVLRRLVSLGKISVSRRAVEGSNIRRTLTGSFQFCQSPSSIETGLFFISVLSSPITR